MPFLNKFKILSQSLAQKIYQRSNYNFQLIIRNILQIFNISYSKWKIIKPKEIFKQAKDKPIWLGWNELEALQKRYPFTPKFNYSKKNILRRGANRATEILQLIQSEKREINSFLELGCGYGMTCAVLQKIGKYTTGVDIIDDFDERVVKSGSVLLQMDAANLKFEDESFDFVFSFDAFEHFLYPEEVLKEAIRVVKKNGFIYLSFGPLYFSPHGRHAYRSITVPYCQFLFPIDLIKKFIEVKGLRPLTESTYNEWSIEDFRKLWDKYSHEIEKIKYREFIDPAHLDLVMMYPSCFKSKINTFENLIISNLIVLFKKI